MSAEQTRKLIASAPIWAALLLAALLDGCARRLHRAGTRVAGARPRRDVAELPAGLHRRAVVRPCRLFRPWRLRRRADAEIPRAEHAAGAARSACCWAASAGAHPRHADRAPARRLFRDGDDRLRPGVLLHRLPVELADRRRRRLARLLAPAARLRLSPNRHSRTTTQLLFLRAVLLRAARSAPWRSSCARRSAAP